MKVFISLLLVFMMLVPYNNPDINLVRTNYSIAVQDKNLCKRMIEELEQSKEKSAVYLAYLGGYQTIWAHHVFSPMSKFSTFKKGKKNIELAISKEPENVEIRYIRFMVQKNAPSFLGYNGNLKEDKDYMIKNKNNVHSELIQKDLEKLLK